jgi:hypothetical protein
VMTNWSNLPDPRSWSADGPGSPCSVLAFDENWKHIVNRHVRNRAEPWEEWVTAGVVREVGQASSVAGATSGWIMAIQNLAAQMKDAVLQSFQRPRVVLICEHTHPTAKPVRKWILVLPTGAKMIVRCAKSAKSAKNVLLTCFFPEPVCDEAPADRCRVLAEMLVLQYCPKVQGGIPGHPPRWHVYANPKTHCFHDRIQFVTLTSWGFDGTDNSWSRNMGDWSPSGKTAKLRPVLVKRRSNAESEASHVCK